MYIEESSLLVSPWAGIPTVDGNGQQPRGPVPGPANNAVFPPVLKDEAPSTHILRYMDGITKRVQKLQEP